MRFENDQSVTLGLPIVTLSRRNLLVLLSKLHTPGSACSIVGDGVLVIAEDDETHYGNRESPPGVMHPTSEAFLKTLEKAIEDYPTRPLTPL